MKQHDEINLSVLYIHKNIELIALRLGPRVQSLERIT